MRDYIADNAIVFQRLDRIELKQFETDENIKHTFKQLKATNPDKAVMFFKWQMWDATSCIEEIIGKAEKSIILIDGYVDKVTLDMLICFPERKPEFPLISTPSKRAAN